MEGAHASRLTDVVSLEEGGSSPEHSFPDSQSFIGGPRVASGADNPAFWEQAERSVGVGVSVEGILSFCRYFPGIGDCSV